jgi:rhodanese-related sulfurtransferase
MSFFIEGDGVEGDDEDLDFQRQVFTGDILFVGDIGRPDLRDATTNPRVMAEALYDTLHRVLFRLPHDTIVYPAHGAGSLCGRKIGTAPQSTIGAEKANNWANQFASKAEFVAAMLANLPDRPAYFAHDVAVNLEGARPLAEVPQPQLLTPQQLRQMSNAQVVDTRDASAYGSAHLAGSFNVGITSPMFSTWAGFFVKPDVPIVLIVSDPEDAHKAWLDLARIGYENVQGYLEADATAWSTAGLEVRSTPQVDVCSLGAWLNEGKSVLDVRTPGEWHDNHMPGAQWVPLSQLTSRLNEVPRGPLAVMCGSGYRSSLAASLLERAGFTDVVNAAGGWSAFAKCGCRELDLMDLTCPAPVNP